MTDHTSTAKEIAAEYSCSVATVNNRATAISIKLKGRSPEDHARLAEAMKTVKPRKRKGKSKSNVAVGTPRKRKAGAAKPEFSTDIDAYFKQGKSFISNIRRRIAELDKEKAGLEEKLNALLLLHPESRK